MSATFAPRISLIDLNDQLKFVIDDGLKREISFAETLIVSCGHYEGGPEEADVEEESVASEWTCTSTTKSDVTQEEVVKEEAFEIKDAKESPPPEEASDEDDDDFQFYFFPDCTKPPKPKGSKDSIIIGPDGIPKINQAVKKSIWYCTCEKNRKGVCECFIKIPCHCGAKKAAECTCRNLSNICICDDNNLQPVCDCENAQVCTCFPGAPRKVCTCHEVEKPCVCYPDKFPAPVCTCPSKPKFGFLKDLESFPSFFSGEYGDEEEMRRKSTRKGKKKKKAMVLGDDNESSGKKPEESSVSDAYRGEGDEQSHVSLKSSVKEESSGPHPCECQKPERKRHCQCLKGAKCECTKTECLCGVQKTCVCEPDSKDNILCKSDESQSICSCDAPKVCTCKKTGLECKCFPSKTVCECKDPANCKCLKICDCVNPCLCDIPVPEIKECICLDKAKQIMKGHVCKCPPPKSASEPTAIKKVRAGKQGYRWCHDVDPKHTFFDYGYDMHDKINAAKQEEEKFKILGLHDEVKMYEKSEVEICPVHGVKVPPFKKKVRKASIDCCSTVGGINFSVETLGEDRDKFLVQVVSHTSKEGARTCSKIVSIMDMNLHTLEENRVERITKNDLTKERRSYMAICESGYYNKITYICGDRKTIKRNYHAFDIAHDFLLEGANVVFLRYLGLRRHKGTVKTNTVLVNGTICESVYVCPGVSQSIVNGKPMCVVKVERHIIEPSGYILQTLTVLSLRGYIISHEWADNNYMLHINPLLNVIPEDDEIEQHAPLRTRWRDDLQLFSDFLDYKSKRSSEASRYVAENGYLTNTIKDFLQSVLFLKPSDVIHFTRHYFDSALSSMDLPHNEYFDPCPKHVRYYYFEE